MKTSHKQLGAINQNVLIFIAIIITLLGITLKANAKADPDKLGTAIVANSMKLHVNNTNLSILIPKLELDQLNALQNVIDGQLAYVTNSQIGFHMFSDNQWSKVNAVAVLKIVQEMVSLSSPSVKNIILTEASNGHSNLLDYNGHVREVNEHFDLNNSEQNFAATKIKE